MIKYCIYTVFSKKPVSKDQLLSLFQPLRCFVDKCSESELYFRWDPHHINKANARLYSCNKVVHVRTSTTVPCVLCKRKECLCTSTRVGCAHSVRHMYGELLRSTGMSQYMVLVLMQCKSYIENWCFEISCDFCSKNNICAEFLWEE